MKLAKKAFIVALTMLALIVTMSAQTLRLEEDPRNIAPTAGTGGSPGGPTGLFTVYDGQTLRRGEFTFSLAYSNFDRDPGDVDIVEVPISFQIGLNDYLELFFNTDMYRAIKVNSPRNLSGFYLPNSSGSLPAIVLAPQGPGGGPFAGQAVFRPQGTAPFVQFPYVGGNAGTFGFQNPPFSGPIFGFPGNVNAQLGPPVDAGGSADNFPGIGSVFGGILPGVVLQTVQIAGAGPVPAVFTREPSYLPDAPFLNRRYGESAFNTFTIGAKWRFTGPKNPVGIGLIPFYRFYADKADDFAGFNQLQRGASPGGNRGDIGLVFFADARIKKWANVSGNVGYIYNSNPKGEFPGGSATLLDRPDEFLAAIALDFPVNRYFQPILEFRTTQYVGGRTPNAFENSPMDGLAGARWFPARWFSLGGAYRYHFNSQNRDSFDDDELLGTVTVFRNCTGQTEGCTPQLFTQQVRGIPPGFRTSTDPHGFMFQITAGRRNGRDENIVVRPVANVDAVDVSTTTIKLPCEPGLVPAEGESCPDNQTVNVTTRATNPEGSADVLTYQYTVSGGRVVGSGANVSWDLSGARPGTYTITSAVDNGCGFCGATKTQTIVVEACKCVSPCNCPTLTVTGPSGVTPPGESMTFTANLSGGNQDGITFSWSVDNGTIESGQGTPVIRVATTPEMAGQNVRATVNLGGLDPACGCTTEASETGIVEDIPDKPIEEGGFGKLSNDEVRQRLDQFFITLQNNPNDQGYIINYGPDRDVTARERLIRNHITFRGFPPERITLVRGGDTGEGIQTRLWRVPPGATPPNP